MIQTIIGFVIIAGFLLVEIFLRKGESARSLDGGRFDRGSTRAVGAVYGVAVVLPTCLLLAGAGRIESPAVSWIGLALMLSGFLLRAWSMQVLGAFYSRTLRVSGSQDVVERGPYRIIRHPGYLGSIILWIGSGFAFSNWIDVMVIAPLVTGVYVYRIHAEEEMLSAALGQRYQRYRKNTWKLFPFLF